MSNSLRQEVQAILSLRPTTFRKASIDPWSVNPLCLRDYVEEYSLPTIAKLLNIETDMGNVMFFRFAPDWTDNHIDVIVAGMTAEWKMQGDGSMIDFSISEPERGPKIEFYYDLDTDKRVLYDDELDLLLHGVVACVIFNCIETLRVEGTQLEDSRRH